MSPQPTTTGRDQPRSSAGAEWLSMLIRRSTEVRLLDTSLALSSRLFVAVIPLALLLTAVLSDRTFSDRLVAALHLEGPGRAAAESLFATPGAVKAGMTVATLAVVLYSLVSCAGVLQRAYREVWDVEGSRSWNREILTRSTWAVALAVYVGVSFGVADTQASPGVDFAFSALRMILAVAFFAWTPYLLLDREIPARNLLPTAILSAVALSAVTLVAPLYMPGIASASADSYGLVGFAFTFLTWMFTQAFLVLAAAVVGADLGDRGWFAGREAFAR